MNIRCVSRFIFAAAWGLMASLPLAAQPLVHMGYSRLAQPDGGTTSVFYPTLAEEKAVSQGPFQLSWAADGPPVRGNGRLIVVSHGSGGSPWVHTDLARALVQHGFVVAMPQHAGDNHLDPAEPGPASWKRRPHEVSQAIDRLEATPSLAPLLQLDAVGVFGGSAGGHTALTLAGGEWSEAQFRDHCLQHIENDFSSCVGFTTLLRGNWLDGLKVWLAKQIIQWRFGDGTIQKHTDDRVRSVVAMVPFAADFSPASLAHPRVPLGLVIAEQDINQVPEFHVKAIEAACQPRCEVLADLPHAGHGAMLSPLPPFQPGTIAHTLLSDPPTFDRTHEVPELNKTIALFFVRTLGATTTAN